MIPEIGIDLRTKSCSISKCYSDLSASGWTRGAVEHVARKCVAVLGQRHAQKQRSKARCMNTIECDVL
ncbi:hypothetical protein EPK84_30315 [Sinorhizobium fredii]|nr:hypothetical protein EPK84_30315 [Sinorhizobium fredii]